MKYSIEYINEYLTPFGWKCISTEYKTIKDELVFICKEGHQVFSSFDKTRKKLECPICAKNTLTEAANPTKKEKGVFRILALDQSTRISGWAIYDGRELKKCGKFSVDYNDEIKRDFEIKNWMIQMIKNWDVDLVGIEGIQMQEKSEGRNMGVTVFQTLARLQGILMECCHEMQLPYQVVPTNTWRHHCGVKGVSRSDRKASMRALVKKWHDITVSDDESDAVGIGKYLSENYTPKGKVESWE